MGFHLVTHVPPIDKNNHHNNNRRSLRTISWSGVSWLHKPAPQKKERATASCSGS